MKTEKINGENNKQVGESLNTSPRKSFKFSD